MNQGDVDLVINLEGFVVTPHLSELVYEEDHVVLGWAGKRAMHAPIDAALLAASAHVVVRFGRSGQESFAERELVRPEFRPHVVVVAASFASAPAMLVGTPLISVVHRQLANRACIDRPLWMQEVACALPTMRQTMLHHPLRRIDVGLRRQRAKLRDGLEAQRHARIMESDASQS